MVIVEQMPATTERKIKFLTATNLKHQRKPVWAKK